MARGPPVLCRAALAYVLVRGVPPSSAGTPAHMAWNLSTTCATRYNFSATVRVLPGRLSGRLSVCHSESFLYGGFVWAHRERLTVQNGCFWPGQSWDSLCGYPGDGVPEPGAGPV
jgi:hypothetical protein